MGCVGTDGRALRRICYLAAAWVCSATKGSGLHYSAGKNDHDGESGKHDDLRGPSASRSFLNNGAGVEIMGVASPRRRCAVGCRRRHRLPKFERHARDAARRSLSESGISKSHDPHRFRWRCCMYDRGSLELSRTCRISDIPIRFGKGVVPTTSSS